MKLKMFAIGTIFLGFWCISQARKESADLEALRSYGVKVPGTLERGLQQSGEMWEKSYSFDVKWQTAEGKRMEKTVRVTDEFAERHLAHGRITDPEVTVCYSPSDPGKVIISGGVEDSLLGVYFGAATVLAGLFGTWYLFFKKA